MCVCKTMVIKCIRQVRCIPSSSDTTSASRSCVGNTFSRRSSGIDKVRERSPCKQVFVYIRLILLNMLESVFSPTSQGARDRKRLSGLFFCSYSAASALGASHLKFQFACHPEGCCTDASIHHRRGEHLQSSQTVGAILASGVGGNGIRRSGFLALLQR